MYKLNCIISKSCDNNPQSVYVQYIHPLYSEKFEKFERSKNNKIFKRIGRMDFINKIICYVTLTNSINGTFFNIHLTNFAKSSEKNPFSIFLDNVKKDISATLEWFDDDKGYNVIHFVPEKKQFSRTYKKYSNDPITPIEYPKDALINAFETLEYLFDVHVSNAKTTLFIN